MRIFLIALGCCLFIAGTVAAQPYLVSDPAADSAELLQQEMCEGVWADPFCGLNSPAKLKNDIDPSRGLQSSLDALEWLRGIDNNSMDGVLFDPPYSVEQCLRKYTPIHNGTAGRAEYWARCKDEISRIVNNGGKSISFCWDSTGIGKKRGFEITRILLVCHGACHNDTIVTVEEKK